MLEGKVSGVQITSDGQPGADPTVRIRGVGSFGSTAPLYVIDGVPMGTSIRDFSSNDIETIQVLKDASAAAIYGSRAANGVIIITTKRGQKDQPLKVDYNGYFGADFIPKGVYDVMNADQYSQYLGQACANPILRCHRDTSLTAQLENIISKMIPAPTGLTKYSKRGFARTTM